MEVGDDDLRSAEVGHSVGRHDVTQPVVVVGVRRQQDAKAITNRDCSRGEGPCTSASVRAGQRLWSAVRVLHVHPEGSSPSPAPSAPGGSHSLAGSVDAFASRRDDGVREAHDLLVPHTPEGAGQAGPWLNFKDERGRAMRRMVALLAAMLIAMGLMAGPAVAAPPGTPPHEGIVLLGPGLPPETCERLANTHPNDIECDWEADGRDDRAGMRLPIPSRL